MTLIHDLDLARLDPSLFRDAEVAGHLVLEQTGMEIADYSLIAKSDIFIEDHVGRVCVVGDAVLELVELTSALEMVVSRVRMDGDALLMPTPISEASLRVTTFAPLIAKVESDVRAVLRLGETDAPGGVADEAVLNLDEVADLVALACAAQAFAAASAHDPDDASLVERARLYGDLREGAKRRLTLLIDRNGDGEAESARPFQVVQLRRA